MDHWVLSPLGSILKSHGLKGTVLLKCSSLKIELKKVPRVLWLGENAQVARPWIVDHLQMSTKNVYLKLREINSREEADYLSGLTVFVQEESEPNQTPFNFVGYRVRVVDSSTDLGIIESIDETGPQALYVVQSAKESYLVPAVAELIERIDHNHRTVIFKEIEGLFPV